MTKQRMYSVRELNNLMKETYNWETLAKFLEHNATLLVDFNNQIDIHREKFFFYKGRYWYFTREKGEIVSFGWETNKPAVVEHWENRGYQFVIKDTKKPLGKINENVHYIIAGE